MKEYQFYRLMDAIEEAGADAIPKAMQSIQPTTKSLKLVLNNQNIEDFVPVLVYFSMYAADKELRTFCSQKLSEIELK